MAEFNKAVKAKGDFSLENMAIIERDKKGDITGVQYLEKLLSAFDGEEITFSASTKEDIAPSEVE
jgi:hypothetical protein